MANLTGKNISSSYQELVVLSPGNTITDGTGSLITNLAVTASNAVNAINAVTASFAINAGVTVNTGSLMVTGSVSSNVLTFTKGDGSAFNLTVNTGSAVTVNTGSLMVTGSAINNVLTFTKGDGSTFNVTVATGSAAAVNTGSLMVTASAALNVITFTKGDASTFAVTVDTGSTAVTASYALNAERLGGDLPAFYATATSVTNLSSSVASRLTTDEAIITSLVAATSSYALKTQVSGAFDNVSSSFASRLTTDEAIISSLVAATASYARTNVNNTFTGLQTFNNIAVNGTASISYLESVSGSAKIIGDAFIILNNDTPTLRYAGIKVIDSGSANVTASFLFDGQTNDWFYEYESGGPTNFGAVLFGPEYGTLGSPVYPTANQLQKGTGGNHITGSNISDNGALVTVSVPVSVTGAVTASLGFKGNLDGNAVSASFATTASFAITAATASFASSASYVTGQADGTLTGDLQFTSILGEIYGTPGTPTTGNLTISATSTKRQGAVAVVFHTGSIEPIVAGGTVVKKLGVYSETSLNVITLTKLVGDNYLEYIAGDPLTVVPTASFAITASSAISAAQVSTTPSFDNTAFDLVFVANHTVGTQAIRTSDNNNINFNPFTGVLQTTTFSGNATTATSASHALFANTAGTAATATSASFAPNFYNSNGDLTSNRIVDFLGNNLDFDMTNGESFTIDTTALGSIEFTNLTEASQSKVVGYNPSTGQLTAMNTSSFNTFPFTGSAVISGLLVITGSVRGEVTALTISSNTASMNLANDNFFTLQLVSGSNTFINPSNILPGQTVNLRVNTTGSATVSFPSSVKQVSGSSYVPTATAGVDVVTFISFDSTSLLLSNVKTLI